MTYRAGGTPPASEIPPSVRNAALLLWTLVGLMVVRTVLTIVFLDDLLGAYANGLDGGAAPPPDIASDRTPAYVPIAVTTLVVLGGLLAVCAVFVPRAAGWTRVVATMFASLAALAGLLVLLQPTTPLFTLLGVLNGVVAVTAVVLLFSRTSNAYFREQRLRRRKAAR
ncbi:MAG: hypothetical protein M3500_04205 [Actinomycetota bacterium]|nr:hypothetical protein [Actinomycetota bacterium]